jgi:hypothetical protein
MSFTLDREFIDVSTELIAAMRAAGYSPSKALEVLIGAVVVIRRESEFAGNIEEAADIIRRAIVEIDSHIVRAN